MKNRSIQPFLIAATLVVVPLSGMAKDESLKKYCIESASASPADCQCGNDTALKITTAQERKALLTMMAGDRNTRMKLSQSMNTEQMKSLMSKMEKISKGCKGN